MQIAFLRCQVKNKKDIITVQELWKVNYQERLLSIFYMNSRSIYRKQYDTFGRRHTCAVLSI